MERTILAFLLAPAWVPLGMGLYGEDRLITAVSGILAYLGTFLVGFPIFLWLRSSRLSGWLSGPIGFAVGTLLSTLTLIGFSLSLGYGLADSISNTHEMLLRDQALVFLPGTMGFLVGLTIWIVTRPWSKAA